MHYWSWILTAVGVCGLWLAGRRNLAGWALGLGAQGLWVAYALSTEQYGFLFSAAAYGWVYATNLKRWTQEKNVPVDDPAPEEEPWTTSEK